MTIPIACRCGQLQGHIETKRVATRAVCYCKDCQAYARFLGGDLVNANGGTEVVAMLPKGVHFTQGDEQLVCMSLSPRGLLRWYAKCCRTPISITPRARTSAYAGIPRACMKATDAELDAALGPLRAAVYTEAAQGPVASTGGPALVALVKVGGMLLRARLGGAYKHNPFFSDSGVPVRVPELIDLETRARLYAATS